jgi:hypothetical protein
MARPKKEDFVTITRWIALHPYADVVETVLVPAARKYLYQPIPAHRRERLKRNLEITLVDLRSGRASHPALTRFALLLVCYYRISNAEQRFSERGTKTAFRNRAIEWTVHRLVRSMYPSKEDFLTYPGT